MAFITCCSSIFLIHPISGLFNSNPPRAAHAPISQVIGRAAGSYRFSEEFWLLIQQIYMKAFDFVGHTKLPPLRHAARGLESHVLNIDISDQSRHCLNSSAITWVPFSLKCTWEYPFRVYHVCPLSINMILSDNCNFSQSVAWVIESKFLLTVNQFGWSQSRWPQSWW